MTSPDQFVENFKILITGDWRDICPQKLQRVFITRPLKKWESKNFETFFKF